MNYPEDQDSLALSHQQFRQLLIASLADSPRARAIVRRSLLPSLPIQGGQGCAHSAADISHGDFGASCSDTGNYTFNGGGNVGIGTTSGPSAPLQISATPNANAGILHLRPAAGQRNYITFTENTVNNQGAIGFDASGTAMNFLTGGILNNGSVRMAIPGNGNVGIGTTSPSHLLAVGNGTSNSVSNQAKIIAQDTSAARLGAVVNNKFAYILSDGTAAAFGGYDYGSSSSLPVLISPDGGNVGIGTTSPAAKLDVNGGINASGSVVIGGTATKQNPSFGGPERLSFQDSSQDKVCIGAFVSGDATGNGRYLLDMKGNHEWGILGEDQDSIVYHPSIKGRMNLGGSIMGGLGIVARTYAATKNVEDATNATPIVIKITSHGYADGSTVLIKNVQGNTAANGVWEISVVDADHFSLKRSAGNGPYTGGPGTASLETRPVTYEAQPRILLNNDGTGILFTDGVNPSDASISRPSANQIYIQGDALLAKSGGNVGFYGTTPVSQRNVTGSRANTEQALKNLLIALAQLGLIINNTTM